MAGGCNNAQVSADPSNGPLHGVASTVDKTPLLNAPVAPSRSANSPVFPDPTNPGIGISQTPRKLSANTNTTEARTTLKATLLNCSPQLQPRKIASVARIRNTDITPAEYHRFSTRIRPRRSPACCT